MNSNSEQVLKDAMNSLDQTIPKLSQAHTMVDILEESGYPDAKNLRNKLRKAEHQSNLLRTSIRSKGILK